MPAREAASTEGEEAMDDDNDSGDANLWERA